MDTQGIDSEETDAKPVSESAARKAPRKAPISAPAQGPAQLRVAVGIATVGRPEIVVETIARLSNQTLPPARIVVCSPTEKDVAGVAEAHPYVEILIGPRGASVQRNAIIDALTDCDAVVFFDDDFVAAPGYLAAVEVVMRTDETVVMTTGRVLADGINGPGITLAEADEIVAERAETTERFKGYAEIFGGYGCNMAVRLAPLREHQLRFDDKLPLYSWLEDPPG
ncbi:MAG: glycosyltransferase [Pseudomonadota bacterium]